MGEITIPGDAGGLAALASQLGSAADQVGSVQGRVSSNTLEGAWSGHAAQAFRSTLHDLPGELTKVEQAFGDAGRALGVFSSKLSELQSQANWYNGQLESARHDLEAAEAGRREAESELRAAKQRGSTAADPVTQHTAQRAVDAGESAVGRAAADVEDTADRISSLERSAAQLRDEYQQAVRACCSALEGSRHSGHGSFLSKAAGWAAGIGKLGERGVAAVVHTAKDGIDDFEEGVGADLEWLDDHWDSVRKDLSGLTDGLGELGLAAFVVAMIPGVDVAVAGAVLLTIMVAGVATSTLMAGGDAIEASRGKRRSDGESYAANLPGDLFDIVAFGSGVRGAVEVIKEAPVALSAAGPIEEKVIASIRGNPEFKDVVQDVDDLPRVVRQGLAGVDYEAHEIVHGKVHEVLDHADEDVHSLGSGLRSALRGLVAPPSLEPTPCQVTVAL